MVAEASLLAGKQSIWPYKEIHIEWNVRGPRKLSQAPCSCILNFVMPGVGDAAEHARRLARKGARICFTDVQQLQVGL